MNLADLLRKISKESKDNPDLKSLLGTVSILFSCASTGQNFTELEQKIGDKETNSLQFEGLVINVKKYGTMVKWS
jgi:hypothetical protein